MNLKAIVRSSNAGSPARASVRRTAGGRTLLSAGSALVAALSLLTACSIPLPTAQPDTTRYYLLSSAAVRPGAKAETASKPSVLGVRNVEIPSYLRNKSFAIRSHANEVTFLDLVRWGEPLDQGIARVLVENLQALPNVARVSTQPFRADERRDFDLLVQVSACEGVADGTVQVSATWRIAVPTAAANTVAEGRFTAAGLRWDGHDYGQLAAKLSEALAGLSHDIGVALPTANPLPAQPGVEAPAAQRSAEPALAFPPAEAVPAKPAPEPTPAKPASDVAKPAVETTPAQSVVEAAPTKPGGEPAKPAVETAKPGVDAAPAQPPAGTEPAQPPAPAK
jgi:uncharacterized lipoprotein YmbA